MEKRFVSLDILTDYFNSSRKNCRRQHHIAIFVLIHQDELRGCGRCQHGKFWFPHGFLTIWNLAIQNIPLKSLHAEVTEQEKDPKQGYLQVAWLNDCRQHNWGAVSRHAKSTAIPSQLLVFGSFYWSDFPANLSSAFSGVSSVQGDFIWNQRTMCVF